MRILVADQSRTMRNIARAVLAQLGHYDVDEATNAAEAVSRASFARFDLCIVDHSMRNPDGSSLINALRRVGGTAGFILLRPSDSPEFSGLDSGLPALETLQKPFAPDALRRCIDGLVASQTALRAA